MRIAIPPLVVLFAVGLTGCPTSLPPTELAVTVVDRPSAEQPSAQADQVVPLEQLVEATLQENLQRRSLSASEQGAWQILHGVLAYGDQFTLETPLGSRPAIEYLCGGGFVKGFEPRAGDLFGDPPRRGLRMDMQPSTKVGQGHRDQWLAIMVQSGLSMESTVVAGDDQFTIADWVRQTEYDLPRNLEAEFSWTLIALTALADTDRHWQARDGRTYGIESLLESELQQDLATSSCGGTHRLIGIAMALQRRRQEQAPITGIWVESEARIATAIELAKQNQNPDGSYSVDYFHRSGWTRDLGETLGTTGHVVEFLAVAAPDRTLRQPWVERSVRHLCQVLSDCRDVDLECGVLYHALHGLAEFRQRLQSLSEQ